jgi:RNA polymerase sigma-70 factor (family 1)
LAGEKNPSNEGMTPTEWILLKPAVVKGDETAFAQLYDQLWSKLYSTTYNYVRDKAISSGIVQDAFVKLWINRSTLEDVKDITAFAMTTIKFAVYDHFDKKAVEQKYLRVALRNSPISSDDAHLQVEYEETLRVIKDEIENLPATTRKVFQLSRVHKFSNEEIARRLKLSVKAVEYHITQSLKQLRLRIGNLLSLLLLYFF